jgi:hypothetical protein
MLAQAHDIQWLLSRTSDECLKPWMCPQDQYAATDAAAILLGDCLRETLRVMSLASIGTIREMAIAIG